MPREDMRRLREEAVEAYETARARPVHIAGSDIDGEALELMSSDTETIKVTMRGTDLSASVDALCYKNVTFQGDRVVYSYVIKEDTADSPTGP